MADESSDIAKQETGVVLSLSPVNFSCYGEMDVADISQKIVEALHSGGAIDQMARRVSEALVKPDINSKMDNGSTEQVLKFVLPVQVVAQPATQKSSMSVTKSLSSDEKTSGLQKIQATKNDQPAPIGLLGGLQPKKRGKAGKPTESNRAPGASLSVSRNQQNVAGGQQILQSLVSNSPNQAGTLASSVPVLPARQRGEPVDISSMISGILKNPAFEDMLNVSGQTGAADSPNAMRDMMEQLTMNPQMLGQIVNQVDGTAARGTLPGGRAQAQAGLDFSTMVQQMMPMVSQIIGAGAGQSGFQDQSYSSRSAMPRKTEGYAKIDVTKACNTIENDGSPESVFRAVLGSVSSFFPSDASIKEFVQDLGSDSGLANDYMKLLIQQVQRRQENAI